MSSLKSVGAGFSRRARRRRHLPSNAAARQAPAEAGAYSLIFLFLCLAAYAQDAPRTIWDGVYTEEQAQRGRATFLDACSNCHGRDLEGADMTPPLTGAAFTANWDGLTVGDLADRIRVSMPLNSPGTLTRQQNADVVAYILRFNQFPAGKEELPREVPAMKLILFKANR